MYKIITILNQEEVNKQLTGYAETI